MFFLTAVFFKRCVHQQVCYFVDVFIYGSSEIYPRKKIPSAYSSKNIKVSISGSFIVALCYYALILPNCLHPLPKQLSKMYSLPRFSYALLTRQTVLPTGSQYLCPHHKAVSLRRFRFELLHSRGEETRHHPPKSRPPRHFRYIKSSCSRSDIIDIFLIFQKR